MKKFVKVLRLALPYSFAWSFAGLCMIIFTLCNTVSVMGMIPLIDKVLSNKPVKLALSVKLPFHEKLEEFLNILNNSEPLKLLNMICIFLIIVTLIKIFSEFFQMVVMEWVSQKISRDLRVKLFNKFFYLPFTYFQGAKTGELISRISLDVNIVQVMFSGRFTNTILDSLHFFPFLGIVLIIDYKMTIICFIVIPLALLPIIFIGRQIRKLTHKTQQNIAEISSGIFEVLNAMKIIKVFGQKEKEEKRFFELCNKTVKARVKSAKKEALLSPVTELIGVTSGVFLLWKFAPIVLEGKMSLGTFLTYITCIACMIKPIKTFGRIQIMIQNSMAGADRIYELLDEKDEKCEMSGNKIEIVFEDSIIFENVKFGYDGNMMVLDGISLEIKKGEIVALVGPSGAGKTTVANMLTRFFDPVSGRITIDGIDMREIHVNSIRKIMAMVTQEPVLFNASIEENIGYGNPGAGIYEIEKAAKLARAHDFIIKTSKQYKTIAGERGVRLSGGEKQRIAIARALLCNPDIIIFDEATSALDTENEKFVQEAIDRVMENRTVLIIAHRLSTVAKADKIFVLDKGRIVQRGTHKELINTRGLYKKLYEMNFEA